MPEPFDRCRREGGKIRTIKPSKDQFQHICIDKKGKSHAGFVKRKKGR